MHSSILWQRFGVIQDEQEIINVFKFTIMANTKTLLGFLAGAAVGALAGILLAPDKGSETRKKISKKTGDLGDSLKGQFNDFIDGVKRGDLKKKYPNQVLPDDE